jgi:hypothetical protein
MIAMTMPQTINKAFIKGYRSGLEAKISASLKEQGLPVYYETIKVPYRDDSIHTYTPDFLLPNGIIIETKGRFTSGDRVKHLRVKEQQPDLDIRFVFQNSRNRLSKASRTTYAKWCEQHGFLYADKEIPQEWISEPKRKVKINKFDKKNKSKKEE